MKNVLFALALTFLTIPAFAVEDGTYDAVVTTDSGSYTVPVEIEDGEVTYVHWPNGGDMTLFGAEIIDCEATGTNSRGDSITIEVEDCDADTAEEGE